MGHILPLCETPKCSWISHFLAVDCFWDKWKTLACLIQTKKKISFKITPTHFRSYLLVNIYCKTNYCMRNNKYMEIQIYCTVYLVSIN